MTQPAFDFTKLSPEERLDLIGEIWDSLENEALPISQELRRNSTDDWPIWRRTRPTVGRLPR